MQFTLNHHRVAFVLSPAPGPVLNLAFEDLASQSQNNCDRSHDQTLPWLSPYNLGWFRGYKGLRMNVESGVSFKKKKKGIMTDGETNENFNF